MAILTALRRYRREHHVHPYRMAQDRWRLGLSACWRRHWRVRRGRGNRGEPTRQADPISPTGAANRKRSRRSCPDSLATLELASGRVTFPLLATVYQAPLGAPDFTTFLAGLTGTLKTELAALAQAHWGAAWHGKNLPGNWTSTANDLSKAQPSSPRTRSLSSTTQPKGNGGAGRVLARKGRPGGPRKPIIRAAAAATPTVRRDPRRRRAARCSPRARRCQPAIPCRARLFVAGLVKGDVDLEKLTQMQKLAAGGVLAAAMAGYVQWLAGRRGGTSWSGMSRRRRRCAQMPPSRRRICAPQTRCAP